MKQDQYKSVAKNYYLRPFVRDPRDVTEPEVRDVLDLGRCDVPPLTRDCVSLCVVKAFFGGWLDLGL